MCRTSRRYACSCGWYVAACDTCAEAAAAAAAGMTPAASCVSGGCMEAARAGTRLAGQRVRTKRRRPSAATCLELRCSRPQPWLQSASASSWSPCSQHSARPARHPAQTALSSRHDPTSHRIAHTSGRIRAVRVARGRGRTRRT
eukprot:3371420-Prymnesium_polylepis.1